MSRKKQSRLGQTTLEYVILIVIVVAALLTIQTYLKRGIQGRMRSATDDIGEQYETTATNHTRTIRTNSTTRDITKQTGETSELVGEEIKNVTETYVTINSQQVYMP